MLGKNELRDCPYWAAELLAIAHVCFVVGLFCNAMSNSSASDISEQWKLGGSMNLQYLEETRLFPFIGVHVANELDGAISNGSLASRAQLVNKSKIKRVDERNKILYLFFGFILECAVFCK